MRRAQTVEKENRMSWLVGRGCLQGKWKDYTLGKSRNHLRKKGNCQSKREVIEGGEEANGKRHKLGG